MLAALIFEDLPAKFILQVSYLNETSFSWQHFGQLRFYIPDDICVFETGRNNWIVDNMKFFPVKLEHLFKSIK